MTRKFPVTCFWVAVFWVSIFFFCSSGSASYAVTVAPFTGICDVIAFGGEGGEDIRTCSDGISLDMRFIDQDLFWDGTSLDIDGILIRTTEQKGIMDCSFHLHST